MLRIAPQRMALENMQVKLGEARLQGDASLMRAVAQERPYIESNLTLSEIALGNALREHLFEAQDAAKVVTDNSIWSKQVMNFHPLRVCQTRK